MAEQIKLAEFEMDMDGVIAEAEKYKRTLDELKQKRKEMKKSGETASKSYVQLEASIKATNKEYRDRLKIVQSSIEKADKQENRTKKLTAALDFQGTTIKELRDNNKALNKMRNSANIETEEGRKELAKLNEKLDENNAKIKENVDAYTQQKINIGNYTESVVDAYKEARKQEAEIQDNISALEEARTQVDKNSDEWTAYSLAIDKASGELDSVQNELGDTSDRMDDTGGATDSLSEGIGNLTGSEAAAGSAAVLMESGLAGATAAVKSFTKSTLAFIATPVGAVLAALAAAFLLIKNAISRSEESTHALAMAFAPLKGLFNALMGALKPLGDLLIEGIAGALELITKSFYALIEAASAAMEWLGFEDAAEAMRDYRASIDAAAESARELERAEHKLTVMTREQTIATAKAKARQEELKTIRDDESRSIQERIKANKQLGQVIAIQQKSELEQAKLALRVAKLRAEQDGKTTENLDAITEAKVRIFEINEDISSRQTEFVTNRATLMKDYRAKLKEQAQERIDQLNAELELMKAKQGWQAKSAQEELSQAEAVADEKLSILNKQLKNGLITQTEYEIQSLTISNEIEKKRAETSIGIAKRALDERVRMLQESKNQKRYLDEQELQRQLSLNAKLLAAEQQFQNKRLQQGLISEQQYQDAIAAKRREIEAKNKQLKKQRENKEKQEQEALELIEFQQSIAQMKARNASKFEIKMAQVQEQYSQELEALNQKLHDEEISEKVAAEKRKQLHRQQAAAELKIEQAKNNAMLASTEGMLSAVASLVDESSAAGKGIAIAKALINTYQAITSALNTKPLLPAGLAAAATAAATGFGAVQDIVSTEIPSASGKGSAGGGSQAQGNRNISTSMGFSVNGSPAETSATELHQLDANNLMGDMPQKVAEAVRDGAKDGTQSGMVELSGNQEIARQNSF